MDESYQFAINEINNELNFLNAQIRHLRGRIRRLPKHCTRTQYLTNKIELLEKKKKMLIHNL